MKILGFIANGSEEAEFITCVDLLRRASIDVCVVSINELKVTTSHNFNIIADMCLSDMSDSEIDSYDGIFIPGGLKGVKNFMEEDRIFDVIKRFNDKNKMISAICAAPQVLLKSNIMEKRRYTLYDNMNLDEYNAIYTKANVEKDGNVITARSLNYTIEFALEIISYLVGIEKSLKIKKDILR